ncbi:hypothetical protein JQ628_27190 [Bradyrhizobium lablabi]|uniref:hypothetical protein n=1 Tax=Bradyrhizobium lablabi TaxID=722472 RepID=UPI001BABFC08|nr:hypothetical protein [Bradyrhizobium lablabi]MBR1125235.1 hypothetical protein [Bradyrhizobium lablabi]
MVRESNSSGAVSQAQDGDRVLRYPDGSINFDAYRAAARRARQAAIASSIEGAASFARDAVWWLTGRSGSSAAKQQTHHIR